MKRAVSISIGSSTRDKAVEIELLGEKVRLERIGTDGDMEAAAKKYKELDGVVDAFGVGGADLGLTVDTKYYPLYSVQPMVRLVKKTPLVDGAGLRSVLESHVGGFIEAKIGDYVKQMGKKVFIVSAVDRWWMTTSFANAGYECTFGDLMFSLSIPVAIHTLGQLKLLASLIMPIAGRLPFKWMYPTGEKQEKRLPKYVKWYQWGTVIGGDCLFIKRHMPDRMDGKVIATNTTTTQDVELFRAAGVKYLVTSTPVLEGRSFGTNVMEAAMVAVAGKGRPLTKDELTQMLDQLGFQPQLQELN